MDEDKKQLMPGKSTRYYLAGGLIVFFTVYYSAVSLMSPARKVASIEKEYSLSDPAVENTGNGIKSDSVYISIVKAKSFFESRITMATTDSLSLSVDLHDSTATIEINGVVVHSAGIERFKISKVLNKADENSVISMLSTPLNITHNIATIEKEPLMLKIAPKDTSEYKPDVLPDTTMPKAVNIIFQTDKGIRIYIYGTDNLSGCTTGFFWFDLADRFRNCFDIINNMFQIKVPGYYPSVRIWMDKSDARVIYRAVPRSGQIALRL